LGLAVHPPHVNYSEAQFALTWSDPGKANLWMGLGQVRDLRSSSVEAIIVERQAGPYSDLRDLLGRVSLQPKEMVNLIQCGALDGLGSSRAALLREAEEVRRAGSALQLSFAFEATEVKPETAAQRLAWEMETLGQPLSVHPLDLVCDRLPRHSSLAGLARQPGRPVTTAGARLPGWTGGDGFFLGDGRNFVVVKGETKSPAPWQALVIRGRWVGDGWGSFWLQADEICKVE
jgi:DNA polymerase III alpha subunit